MHEELSPDDPDILIRILNRAIRASIRVLSILMVLLVTVDDIFKLFGTFLVVLIAVEIFVNIRMYLGTNVVPVQLVLATALMAVTMALGVTYWLVARLH